MENTRGATPPEPKEVYPRSSLTSSASPRGRAPGLVGVGLAGVLGLGSLGGFACVQVGAEGPRAEPTPHPAILDLEDTELLRALESVDPEYGKIAKRIQAGEKVKPEEQARINAVVGKLRPDSTAEAGQKEPGKDAKPPVEKLKLEIIPVDQIPAEIDKLAAFIKAIKKPLNPGMNQETFEKTQQTIEARLREAKEALGKGDIRTTVPRLYEARVLIKRLGNPEKEKALEDEIIEFSRRTGKEIIPKDEKIDPETMWPYGSALVLWISVDTHYGKPPEPPKVEPPKPPIPDLIPLAQIPGKIDELVALVKTIQGPLDPRQSQSVFEGSKKTIEIILNEVKEALARGDMPTVQKELKVAKTQLVIMGDPAKMKRLSPEEKQKHDPKDKYIKNDSVDPQVKDLYLQVINLLVATDRNY